MSYPKITFKKEALKQTYEASRWGAYCDGKYLGSVHSLPTGGWYIDGQHGGYETRYVAAYSLYRGAGTPE